MHHENRFLNDLHWHVPFVHGFQNFNTLIFSRRIQGIVLSIIGKMEMTLSITWNTEDAREEKNQNFE